MGGGQPVLPGAAAQARSERLLSPRIATELGPTLRRPIAGRSGARLGFVHGLVAILAVALILRLLLVAATPHYSPATDAADYDRIAVSLAQHESFPSSVLAPHGGPTAFRPPLFPIALAAAYKLTGVRSAQARWRAGRVLEAGLGMLAVALTCLIALRLWDPATALLSGAIAAVFPPLLLVGSSLMSEALYIPLLLAAVLAALTHRRSSHRYRWALLTGALLGLLALTRSNGIALALPIGLLVWRERPRRSWDSLRSPLVVLGATLVTLVPWTVRNASALRAFVPVSTESGYAFAGTYNRQAQNRTDYPAMWVPPVREARAIFVAAPNRDESQISAQLNRNGLHFLEAHPGYLLEVALWNTLRLLNLSGTGFERWAAQFEAYPAGLTIISVYAFWLLAPLAIAGASTRAARRAPHAFWACPLVILLSSVLFIGATRYRSPADPFGVMLAALALLTAGRRWRAARGRSVGSAPV